MAASLLMGSVQFPPHFIDESSSIPCNLMARSFPMSIINWDVPHGSSPSSSMETEKGNIESIITSPLHAAIAASEKALPPHSGTITDQLRSVSAGPQSPVVPPIIQTVPHKVIRKKPKPKVSTPANSMHSS